MTSLTPARDPEGALAVRSSRRGWRWLAYAALVAVVVAMAWWVSTHPDPLETVDKKVVASTPVGEPVYLGVYSMPADFGRSLHVSGVRIFATSNAEVTIVPHVCQGGSVHVTTTPVSFCSEIEPTEGSTLEAGDVVLLEVVGDNPAVVEIDRIRIAYRDGLQWATQDAGAPAQVTVLPR